MNNRDIKSDIIFLIVILFAGLKLTYNIGSLVDISLFDEAGYLYRGISLMSNGLPLSFESPFYSLWYFVLSFYSRDPISLLYLNLKIQMIMLPIFFYIFIRVCGVPSVHSLFGSFLVLISYGNALSSWARSTHFFVIFIILFMSLSSLFINNLPISISILAIGCLLGSYIRPEYAISFILLIIFLIILTITYFNRREFRNNAIFCILILLISSIIFHSILGNPFLDGFTKRGFGAFTQNFAYNYVKWHNLDFNPWVDYGNIINDHFGKINNIISAFFTNPLLFAKHMTLNFINYCYRLSVMLFVHANILIPPSNRLNTFLEGCLLLLLFAFFFIKYYSILRYSLKDIIYQNKIIIIAYLFLIVPSLIEVIVSLPRHEFILIQYILIMATIIILISKCMPEYYKKIKINTVLLAVIMIAISPYLSYNYYFTFRGEKILPIRKLANFNTVTFIRSLNIKRQVNMLEGEGGLNIYIGNNFHWVAQFSKKSGFDEFISQNGINMIVFDKMVNNDRRFKNDSQWAFFLNNYKLYGFEKTNIPRTDRILYIKKGLLDESLRQRVEASKKK